MCEEESNIKGGERVGGVSKAGGILTVPPPPLRRPNPRDEDGGKVYHNPWEQDDQDGQCETE